MIFANLQLADHFSFANVKRGTTKANQLFAQKDITEVLKKINIFVIKTRNSFFVCMQMQTETFAICEIALDNVSRETWCGK